MNLQQPFVLRLAEAPRLPQGWSYLTTEEASIQLKPGKLFDKRTAKSSGRVPILSQGAADFIGYHDEAPGVSATIDEPVVTFANHTCAMRLMTNPFSCIQNIFPKVGKPNVTDTRYFYFATQGRVQITDYKGHHPLFRQALIPIPPLETQRRIASILGAYDDLIEINRRRIGLLEGMARGLFEEWFVRFRFPGHEAVPLVDTPDGPLPEGWSWGTVKDIAVLRSGFTFKSATFVGEGDYSLVTIKHVHNGKLTPPFDSKIDEPPKNMPAHCRIEKGDILLSLTGNVGRACLSWGNNLLLNQRVAKVDWVAPAFRAFCYCWFRLPKTLTLLENISNGAAQQNLSPIRTMEMPLSVPPLEALLRFEALVGPMLEAIVVGFETISNLQDQRDLLLPRLISGQLSVSAATRELEDAA